MRVRLERRIDTPSHLNWTLPLGSLGVALVLGAIVIWATGNSPLDIYSRTFERGFGTEEALTGAIRAATPLLFTALAAAAAFRLGVFNIGGEGQLVMGAIAASGVAIKLGDVPLAVHLPAMVLAGALGGAVWAAVPGFCKARFGTSEIITSLMLNYVAAAIATYLIFDSTSLWRLLEGTGRVFPTGKTTPPTAEWTYSHIGAVDLPFGLWLGAILAGLLWLLYTRTTTGFEINVIRDAPEVARVVGVKTRRRIVMVMALSGALAGIGGASNVGDFTHVLDPKGLQQSGYGYAGIVIASLARLNPLAVIPVAVLMGGISNAGLALQGPDFSLGLVGTLQGLILFCVIGGEALGRYRLVLRSQAAS